MHKGPSRPRRSGSDRRRNYRLAVESVEERLLLSTLMVKDNIDDPNDPNSLRYILAHAKTGDLVQFAIAPPNNLRITLDKANGPLKVAASGVTIDDETVQSGLTPGVEIYGAGD